MNKKNKKSLVLIRLMIFIIVAFSSSVILYTNVINDLKKSSDNNIRYLKNSMYNSIYTYLDILMNEAKEEVDQTGEDVKRDLLSLPKEQLKDIQEDMSNDIHNPVLHKIINNNIKGKDFKGVNNSKNSMLAMTSNGVLEDFNYRRAETISQNSNTHITNRSWEHEIENSFNSSLAQVSVDKLLNRTNGIIAFEPYNLINGQDSHIMIKEFTYDEVKKVYLNEGLDGLRNFQVYIPYYITSNGDIFGQEDIIHGVKQNNNKIIIVQEFNLYDQIINNASYLTDDDEIIEAIRDEYSETIRILYLFGVALVIAICGLIFYFCSLYNMIVEHENESVDTDDSDTITKDDNPNCAES